MAVFKIEKQKNYTVMSNYHLQDRNLSYKAKGLLSFMLSLPEDWDYSLNGLVAVSKESKKAIRNILSELINKGYVVREQGRGEKGYYKYDYIIREIPVNVLEKDHPDTQKGDAVKGDAEKGTQINTNKENTKEQIDKLDKTINEKNSSKSDDLNSNKTHHSITKDLIKRKYLKDDDIELYKYDKLFKQLLKQYELTNIVTITHYIASSVVKRHFLDEYNEIIDNKFGYLKKSIMNNIDRFNKKEIERDAEGHICSCGEYYHIEQMELTEQEVTTMLAAVRAAAAAAEQEADEILARKQNVQRKNYKRQAVAKA